MLCTVSKKTSRMSVLCGGQKVSFIYCVSKGKVMCVCISNTEDAVKQRKH